MAILVGGYLTNQRAPSRFVIQTHRMKKLSYLQTFRNIYIIATKFPFIISLSIYILIFLISFCFFLDLCDKYCFTHLKAIFQRNRSYCMWFFVHRPCLVTLNCAIYVD